jgi:predicted nucleic acid-binding protein
LVQGYLTTHCLAELFATLTALPLKPRLLPAEAKRIIGESILGRLVLIPWSADHYHEAMKLTATGNLSSGAIYDALHLVGALSVGCGTLYTLKLRHFRSIASGDPIIASP